MAEHDPAVEAVRRARLLGSCGDGPADFAEDAAREALKPIRELHQVMSRAGDRPGVVPGSDFAAGMDHVLEELAPLIYPESELT